MHNKFAKYIKANIYKKLLKYIIGTINSSRKKKHRHHRKSYLTFIVICSSSTIEKVHACRPYNE